jgi:hypothetical protein
LSRITVVAMMGLESQRACDIPTAAGADDQRFGARAHGVRERGTLFQQLVSLAIGEVREIEVGDAGGGVQPIENLLSDGYRHKAEVAGGRWAAGTARGRGFSGENAGYWSTNWKTVPWLRVPSFETPPVLVVP